MNCSYCKQPAAIISERPLCKKHLEQQVEQTAKNTIKSYGLIKQNEKIGVACSGGKDSTTTLYLLNKLYANVEALAIDEGVKGYRQKTLADLKRFCKKNKIKLNIYSFKKEFGFTLDYAVKKLKAEHPCYACGILRRYLMNKKARKYDKLATGHNLDDEAQSVLMNLFKAQLPLLARLGPITGVKEEDEFIKRIKPLYFLTEKEIAAYAVVKDFGVRFSECPYAPNAFRSTIRDCLNEYESSNKGAKKRLITNFLKISRKLKKHKTGNQTYCKKCRQPSGQELCRACQLINQLRSA